MSIWDHVKKSEKAAPHPTRVELASDGRGLRIHWSDGAETSPSARLLRQSCPCAECIEEWTRKRLLDPNTVPEDIRIVERREVGNYALGFRFSDGHQTGIFQWVLLRNPSAAQA